MGLTDKRTMRRANKGVGVGGGGWGVEAATIKAVVILKLLLDNHLPEESRCFGSLEPGDGNNGSCPNRVGLAHSSSTGVFP